MKKRMLAIAIVIALLGGLYIIFKEDLDRFNPFIEQEYIYVQINKSPKDDNHRFKYELKGYNTNGKIKKVIFTTSTVLNKGQYLKVSAKGSFTESWESIDEKELPADVNF